MKITSIKQQVKRADRYSIFVDGTYSFSLSESALLESKIHSGLELSEQEVVEFKQLSNDDKLYNQALRYAAMRPRTKWEMETYLTRKNTPAPLLEIILNKLSIIGLVDDAAVASAMIHDRLEIKPSSRRKIIADLRKKRISLTVIEQALAQAEQQDDQALQAVIASKRRQLKYQDDTKLMQYLARQGFRYDDIKTALSDTTS